MTMQKHLPSGYGDARFLFSNTGNSHSTGFSLGVEFVGGVPPFPEAGINLTFKRDILDDGAFIGSNWRYLGVELTIGNDFGVPSTRVQSENLAGTFSASTVPPNCAFLVQKRTGFAGRRYRGRIFMPPCSLTDVDVDAAGNMASALVTSHQVLWDTWLDALVGVSMPPVLIHQYDPALGQSPVDPTTITDFVCQSKIATQRRRLR